MRTNIKMSLVAAAVSAAGLASVAMADTFIESKTVHTNMDCAPTTTNVSRTESVSAPIVEESYRTIEKPVVIETAPIIEERIRIQGNYEKIKIKEYY